MPSITSLLWVWALLPLPLAAVLACTSAFSDRFGEALDRDPNRTPKYRQRLWFWPVLVGILPLLVYLVVLLRIGRALGGRAPAAEGLWVFDLVSLVLPKRVADEELGDALEDINTRIARGEARWRIWLKIASSIAWAVTNSIRFGTRLPPKPASASSQDPRPPAPKL